MIVFGLNARKEKLEDRLRYGGFKSQLIEKYRRNKSVERLHTLTNAKANTLMEKVDAANQFTISSLESPISAFEPHIRAINRSLELLDNSVFEINRIKEQIKSELKANRSTIGNMAFNELNFYFKSKCEKEIRGIADNIHILSDNPMRLPSFEAADFIYGEFQDKLEEAIANQKGALKLEQDRMNEIKEQRLDQDRDQQIADAKRRNDKLLAEKERALQKQLEEFKDKLNDRYVALDKKEALIEEFLRKRQKEMFEELIHNQDDVINRIAEERAMEILKKLGIK